MATVPRAHEPDGGTRVWATFAEPEAAERAARELLATGVERDRVTLTRDPGTTEGPIGHEREHREGTRIFGRLGAGALLGGAAGALIGVVIALLNGAGSTGLALFTAAGALFLRGVGAFLSGLGSLRAATLDHRPVGEEPRGGVGVEVRIDGAHTQHAIEVLRRHRPRALVVTDAFGRPLRQEEGEGGRPAMP